MPATKRTTTAATVKIPSTATSLQLVDLLPLQAALQTFAQLAADLYRHLIERDEAVRADRRPEYGAHRPTRYGHRRGHRKRDPHPQERHDLFCPC